MQNSILKSVEENETSQFYHFLKKLKIAFKFLASPKAIIIIDSQIEAFHITPEQVGVICGKISHDVISHLKEEEIKTHLVNNLVYN